MVALRTTRSKPTRARRPSDPGRSELLNAEHADFLSRYVVDWSDADFLDHLHAVACSPNLPPACRIIFLETCRRFRRRKRGG